MSQENVERLIEEPSRKWPSLLMVALVAFVIAVAAVTVALMLLMNSHPFGWD